MKRTDAVDALACAVSSPVPVPFPYTGPPELCRPVVAALTRVIDPEVALSIVDVGLIYGVTITPASARVRLTMTSAACPVADLIIDEVERELDRVLPAACRIEVELCWDPPWAPEMMSESARRFMAW